MQLFRSLTRQITFSWRNSGGTHNYYRGKVSFTLIIFSSGLFNVQVKINIALFLQLLLNGSAWKKVFIFRWAHMFGTLQKSVKMRFKPETSTFNFQDYRWSWSECHISRNKSQVSVVCLIWSFCIYFQMHQWDSSLFSVTPAASLLSRCVSIGAVSQVRTICLKVYWLFFFHRSLGERWGSPWTGHRSPVHHTSTCLLLDCGREHLTFSWFDVTV